MDGVGRVAELPAVTDGLGGKQAAGYRVDGNPEWFVKRLLPLSEMTLVGDLPVFTTAPTLFAAALEISMFEPN